MARSRIATGANGQNGGYRNHPFPTQLPRNAGTVKVSAPAPPFPLLPPVQKIQSFIVPAPRPLAAFAPRRFRFLPKGIDAHRATLQAIQNPTFKIPLLPRPLAAFAPWRFRFLPKGIDAHRATLQAIQNPTFKIPLLPRPLATSAPRRFKSLSIHIHAHSATRQDLRPAGTSRSLLSKLPTMLQQFGAGRPQISLLALRGIPTILLPCC